ncbi:MAG: hypothetical protein SGI98_05385 [Verrucomicrobiota bacterium]|mgnify:CR=1 FL=1|nr:hypothetical protein [Verrucomicrobiota bacterium]
MKLNVKFSHIERASEKVSPEADQKPQEAVSTSDKDESSKPEENIKAEKTKAPADPKTSTEKKPADQTTRLSLDDLKKQRTRRSGGLIVGLVILVLVGLGVGGYLLVKRQAAGAAATTAAVNYTDFSVNAFLENPASLAGNRYKAQMRVESQLGFSAETGRLLVFKEQVNQKPLAVVVPAKLDKVNLEKGQLLEVKFIIKDGGVIYVEDIQKP